MWNPKYLKYVFRQMDAVCVLTLTLFKQVDAVLTRMTMLKERIEATESCIALDLDHRRNELVAYNLVRAVTFDWA